MPVVAEAQELDKRLKRIKSLLAPAIRVANEQDFTEVGRYLDLLTKGEYREDYKAISGMNIQLSTGGERRAGYLISDVRAALAKKDKETVVRLLRDLINAL